MTGKLFINPRSYENYPAMRAHVERVHCAGRRWGMMPSTPAVVNSFPGIAIPNYHYSLRGAPTDDLTRPRREPRSARAFRGDLDVAREKNTPESPNSEARASFERRPGSHAGAIHAPAPVGVVQTTARRLSPPATASLNGVTDGDKSRCCLGGSPSPETSPTHLEVPRRAPRPLAVARECLPPLPAGSRPSHLMKTA